MKQAAEACSCSSSLESACLAFERGKEHQAHLVALQAHLTERPALAEVAAELVEEI